MFKSLSYKTRMLIFIITTFLFIGGIVSLIVNIYMNQELWITISLIVFDLITFVFAFLMFPLENQEVGTKETPKTFKSPKQPVREKTPFITDKEWEELEMEDDEDEADDRFLEDN